MYYYPRIPKSFSPAPFSHKLYDNSPIERVFHPSMTPQPSNQNQRKRSLSMVARNHVRSRSTTKPHEEISVDKVTLSHSASPNKTTNTLGKAVVHYIDSGNNRSTATHHALVSVLLQDYLSKVYFRRLSGYSTRQLYQKLQPYIKQIVLLNEQNSEIQDSWIPTEYQGISTKEKFLAAIKKLEKINRKEFIRELIIYYCIPDQSVRKQILSNLVADVHVKLKQKTFLDFSFTSYCLVTSRGKIISDILKIPFFTKELLFCEKSDCKDSFLRFKQVKSKYQNQSSLLDVVKNSFRQRVKKVNEDYRPEKVKNFQKKICKETITLVSRRRKLPPEYKHPRSKKDQKSVFIAKIKEKYEISTKQATTFVEEFYTLLMMNGRYNDSERLPSERRTSLIPMINFRENCISLEGKDEENVNKILQSMEFPLDMQTVDISTYVQFRLIVECLAEPARVLKFLVRFLTLDKQKQLTKEMLTDVLRTTLKEYKIPRSNRVIIDILWLQFKRSNLIQYVENQQLLTINRFKENYLLNRTLYYFIMTIIFCTNDPVEAAYEVLT